ncbi:hypothetical protein D3C80_1056730 [compost metagenome]
MHPGQLGGFNNFLGVDIVKASDVFSDGAGKEFDILRQVANVRPQLIFIPLVDISIIKTHNAFTDWPDTDQ